MHIESNDDLRSTVTALMAHAGLPHDDARLRDLVDDYAEFHAIATRVRAADDEGAVPYFLVMKRA